MCYTGAAAALSGQRRSVRGGGTAPFGDSSDAVRCIARHRKTPSSESQQPVMTGPPTFAIPSSFLGVTRQDRDARLVVAGIPLDLGTTNRAGARDGPRAIRQASRMLVDGAHPTRWIDPATLSLADVGDFRIALGDLPASLALIEQQAAGIAH